MTISKDIDNKEISQVLELTGKLLTLHNRDENRAKTFGVASFAIDRMTESLSILEEGDILKLRGIGKSTLSAIREIQASGTSAELEELINITPEGVLEMFKVKGLGVKKIKTLWEELGIDNLNELRIACENGSIAQVKGFGKKTQDAILSSLVYLQAQAGKLRMNKAEELAKEIEKELKGIFGGVTLVGDVVRRMEVVEKISFLVEADAKEAKERLHTDIWDENLALSSPFIYRGYFKTQKVLIELHFVNKANAVSQNIILNSSPLYLSATTEGRNDSFYQFLKTNNFESEEEAFEGYGVTYLPSEVRESAANLASLGSSLITDLVKWDDLRGTVHNHSTYSDGKHTLREMSQACMELGLEYFGIADHSITAAYAGGLTPAEVQKQWEEIEIINKEVAPFRILKGIESDILSDGSLDYTDEILGGFDYVVASVHSGLNMKKSQATQRLIKAVENPHTTILGHPTGRLLLSREAYPINYVKVIDACAANGVIMELNASPWRLDLDWRWIPYCIEKGVKVSINPDAHSTTGLLDMKYGVDIARKGMLTKSMTFNAMTLGEILSFLDKK